MKKLLLLPFCLMLLFTYSCQDEPDDIIDADLHLDGENNTAPLLDPMTYITAVRFARGLTSEFSGQQLDEVEIHITDLPSSCKLKIWSEGTQTNPGSVLHTQDVSSILTPNGWNTISVSAPIEIDGNDLWIGFEVEINRQLQTIGCDFGPARSGGDMFFSSDTNTWETFREFTGDTPGINWNIRAYVR